MSFKFDSSNTGTVSISAGTYEVYANAVNHTATKGGNEMFVFNYFIRQDVEQLHRGQEIRFDNFVITEKAQWRINQFSKAVKTPDGYDFMSSENWARMMLGKPVKVTVKLNEKGYAQVNKIEETEFPNVTIQPVIKSNAPTRKQNNYQQEPQQNFNQDPFQQSSQPIDISDDDLPF